MLIYISGPLQGSADLSRARNFYDDLAAIVRACGHDPYVPHHNTDPESAAQLSAHTVFVQDIAALNASDAVIAHIGLPSTGVGAEVAMAAGSGRRVLGIKRVSERSSRFIEGLILDAEGRVAAIAGREELVEQVRSWLTMPASWFGHPDPLILRNPHHQVVA